MIDYNEMRKKFPAKKTLLKQKSNKAAVKAIAREYEMKKAQLTGGAPIFKKGFVFYTSPDGYHWDEGEILVPKEKVGAFYSNNLNLTDEKGNFLLVQYSDSYQGSRVNVMHMNVRVKR